jgi:Flp pilus assembly protein protease CpaA
MIVVLVVFTFIVLAIASIADLKTREVQDYLSYGLIFSAIGIRLIYGVFDWHVIVSGLFGVGVMYLLALLFYYTGQWGGGDSKLLIGMGAVIGISYPFNLSSFAVLYYMLLVLAIGAIYGVIYLIVISILNWGKFVAMFKKEFKDNIRIVKLVLFFSLAFLIAGLFFKFLMVLVIFPIGFYLLYLFVISVENSCFIVDTKISRVTEGDWLYEDVRLKGRRLMSKRTMEREDLLKLKKLAKIHNFDKVKIRIGIPFVPSFLFAYIVFIILPVFGI